jgi:hypothetical protein
MTTTAADSPTDHHPADPLVDLLELTASAWSDAVEAMVHQDQHAARRVLAGARDRRAAAVRARTYAHARLADARIVLTARRMVRSVNTVQLVGDLERLEQLVVVTARRVLAGRAHLDPDLRPDVATLRRVGAQRLHDLADHGRRDLAYLACSRELDGVIENLVRHARATRRSDGAARLCVALAAGVKEVSRHAARAA